MNIWFPVEWRFSFCLDIFRREFGRPKMNGWWRWATVSKYKVWSFSDICGGVALISCGRSMDGGLSLISCGRSMDGGLALISCGRSMDGGLALISCGRSMDGAWLWYLVGGAWMGAWLWYLVGGAWMGAWLWYLVGGAWMGAWLWYLVGGAWMGAWLWYLVRETLMLVWDLITSKQILRGVRRLIVLEHCSVYELPESWIERSRHISEKYRHEMCEGRCWMFFSFWSTIFPISDLLSLQSILEKKKTKGILKLGQNRSGGLVISQKQGQWMPAHKIFFDRSFV